MKIVPGTSTRSELHGKDEDSSIESFDFLNEGPEKILTFDAIVDLEGLPVPPSANIFMEAHRRAYFKRFPCGTVSAPKFTARRILEGLDSNALVRFRVKVVDKKGRIIAVADNIIPRRTEEEAAGKLCLLPVDFVDLGHAIWRLDLESDWPTLQLNKNMEDIREVARSDNNFLAFVYPERGSFGIGSDPPWKVLRTSGGDYTPHRARRAALAES